MYSAILPTLTFCAPCWSTLFQIVKSPRSTLRHRIPLLGVASHQTRGCASSLGFWISTLLTAPSTTQHLLAWAPRANSRCRPEINPGVGDAAARRTFTQAFSGFEESRLEAPLTLVASPPNLKVPKKNSRSPIWRHSLEGMTLDSEVTRAEAQFTRVLGRGVLGCRSRKAQRKVQI
jgi:hypothetical protein